MPRRVVERLPAIERLEILDETGAVDKALEPKLAKAKLVEFYTAMLTSRRFDERMLKLQRQGRIGTFAPIKGQEASNIGTVAALRPTDWCIQSFRETATTLYRGTPMDMIWLFAAGFNEGVEIPPGTRDTPLCVPVATQLLHAVGIAYAAKLRGEDTVVMAYCGDGGTSEGDFHEAMNYAAVWQVPVIFIVQNNQWAISLPLSKQTASPTIAQKAVAYGMPSVQVDGNDILAVWQASADAVDAARAGQGPALIECVTYRLSVHTTADDPTKYRSADEVALWERRDPIPRFETYLKRKKVLTKAKIEAIEADIAAKLKAAWKTAEARIAEAEADDGASMFDHLYADETADLAEQRQAYLDARARGLIDG